MGVLLSLEDESSFEEMFSGTSLRLSMATEIKEVYCITGFNMVFSW